LRTQSAAAPTSGGCSGAKGSKGRHDLPVRVLRVVGAAVAVEERNAVLVESRLALGIQALVKELPKNKA